MELRTVGEGASGMRRVGTGSVGLIELLAQAIDQAPEPGLTAGARWRDRGGFTEVELHTRGEGKAMPAAGGGTATTRHPTGTQRG